MPYLRFIMDSLRKTGKIKTYTPKEKAEILTALAVNEYNIAKTAKETGVTRNTLKSWFEAGDAIRVLRRKGDELERAGETAVAKVLECNEGYVEKIYKAKEEAVDRIRELLPYCTKMEDLVLALKALSECDPSNPTAGKDPVTLYQQINNNLIQNLDGSNRNQT